MSDDAVLVDVDGAVATITLNRPDQRNALTFEVSSGIVDAVDELEDDPDVRVLVVTGTEGSFCAGGDVNAMVQRLAGEVPLHEAVRHVQQETSRAIRRVREFHRPTVAKVDGVAFGAGANLAIACDCQVASEDARISFGFQQVGLAVDSGTSYLLPRLVGENTAKELVYTGELVDADEAVEMGIFNRVHDADEFEERADAFVEELASGPSVALSASKQVLDQGLEVSFKQALDNEATAQAAVFETDDHQEGAEAFMESRAPEFEGR